MTEPTRPDPLQELRERLTRRVAYIVGDRHLEVPCHCAPLADPCVYHEGVGDGVDAVLAALEPVPDMAISVTEELIEGVPFSVHRKVGDSFCGDEAICAQHQPVYRISVPAEAPSD